MNTKAESMSGIGENATSMSGSTTHKAAKAAHELIDETAAKAESVEQRLRQRANDAGEKFGESQEAVAKQVSKSVDQVEAFVKERPVAAAGIAFAAGIVVAALFRR
jgi:ElaB/YqjD/DUF883 family membrane-anchored ribosome-binding protein